MWLAPTSMTKNHDRKWTFRPGRAGDESEVPVTQAQLDVGSVFGSSAAESAASVAGLSFPSSDDT